ncbi:hypothetical protein KR009_007718 [Drosophila setifemur]|nr:hypothetical protein KR009_007718 [Drosophila setifemur]
MKQLKLLTPFSQLIKPTVQLSSSRVNALLLNVPRVKIDSGKNQYLLISVYLHGQTRFGRTIVRGSETKTHVEIFDEILEEMDKIGICTKSLGGGFIDNREKDNYMKVYGCCKTFGEAPHGRTKDILLSWTKYQAFTIDVSLKK